MKTLLNKIGILVLILVSYLSSLNLSVSKDFQRVNCFKESLKQLKLNVEQKSKIMSLFEKFRNENKSSIEKIKTLKNELKDAKISNNQIKIDEIKPKIKFEIGVLKPKRNELRTNIKEVLSSNQNTELEQLLENCKETKRNNKIIK